MCPRSLKWFKNMNKRAIQWNLYDLRWRSKRLHVAACLKPICFCCSSQYCDCWMKYRSEPCVQGWCHRTSTGFFPPLWIKTKAPMLTELLCKWEKCSGLHFLNYKLNRPLFSSAYIGGLSQIKYVCFFWKFTQKRLENKSWINDPNRMSDIALHRNSKVKRRHTSVKWPTHGGLSSSHLSQKSL